MSSATRDRNVESMGWLTESAAQPQIAKPIQVESNTILDLKAALFQKQAEAKEGGSSRVKVRRLANARDVWSKTNAGVEERNQRDMKANQAETRNAYESLTHKAKLYEQLMSGRLEPREDAEYLVDFERKGWEQIDTTQLSTTSRDAGANPLPMDTFLSTSSGGIYSKGMSDYDERKAWEQAALKEIETGVLSTLAAPARSDTGVKQNYERTMSVEEKEALKEIVSETQDARTRHQEVAAKRKEQLERRRQQIIERERRKLERRQILGASSSSS